jgi:hypothetical protein
LLETVEIIFISKVQWPQHHLLGTDKYPGVAQGWCARDVMHVKSNVTCFCTSAIEESAQTVKNAPKYAEKENIRSHQSPSRAGNPKSLW